MSVLDVRAHLTNAANRRALADRYEAEAVRLAEIGGADNIFLAAAHFTVAEGLRGPARFRQ